MNDAAEVVQNDGGAHDDHTVQGEQDGSHAPFLDFPIDQIGCQIRAAGGKSPGEHDAGTRTHQGTAAERAEQSILGRGRQEFQQIGEDGGGEYTDDGAGHAPPSAKADVQKKQRYIKQKNTDTYRQLGQGVDGHRHTGRAAHNDVAGREKNGQCGAVENTAEDNQTGILQNCFSIHKTSRLSVITAGTAS